MKKSAAFIVAILLIGAVVALITMRANRTPTDELPFDNDLAAGSMLSPMSMIEQVLMQTLDTTSVEITEDDRVVDILTTESAIEAARMAFQEMLGYNDTDMAAFWEAMSANGTETTIADWQAVLNQWYLEPATQAYNESLGNDTSTMTGNQTEIGTPAVAELAGVWVWQETLMNNDEITIPAAPGEFTLAFGSEGVYGTTDCNNFNGAYSVDATAGTLEFGPLASTMMYCEGSQEQEFTGDLAEITHYMISEQGELVLLFRYDSGSMIFAPVTVE